MTKQDLKQLRSLRTEIKLLQEDLKKTDRVTARDSVMGSDVNYPYGLHTIIIEGVDIERMERLNIKISNRLNNLQEQFLALEEWLDSIEDAEIRTIMRLRYRNGMSWQQVAFAIGHYDEQYPRKKHNKFFQINELDEKDEKNEVL